MTQQSSDPLLELVIDTCRTCLHLSDWFEHHQCFRRAAVQVGQLLELYVFCLVGCRLISDRLTSHARAPHAAYATARAIHGGGRGTTSHDRHPRALPRPAPEHGAAARWECNFGWCHFVPRQLPRHCGRCPPAYQFAPFIIVEDGRRRSICPHVYTRAHVPGRIRSRAHCGRRGRRHFFLTTAPAAGRRDAHVQMCRHLQLRNTVFNSTVL